MTAKALDGSGLAQKLQAELAQAIADLTPEVGRPPGLAVLMVGDNPASAAYVRNKERACQRLGIASFGQHLSADTPQEQLSQQIQALNRDERVDGILIQLPLPAHLDSVALLNQLDPDKDVDGLHPVNLGRLVRGEPGLRSCTPAGVMRMLAETEVNLRGQRAVVVGRSILVGKPVALMLLAADATLTVAHSFTPQLAELTRSAEVLVVAIGRPEVITGEMVRPGAVVIDVGINRVTDYEGNSRLVGDVAYASVSEVARLITPVPGGVGPMTVTMLMHNTVWSYCQRHQRPWPFSSASSELAALKQPR